VLISYFLFFFRIQVKRSQVKDFWPLQHESEHLENQLVQLLLY